MLLLLSATTFIDLPIFSSSMLRGMSSNASSVTNNARHFQKDLAPFSTLPKLLSQELSAAYQKGKRDKKTLRNYLYALNLADDSTFNQVAQEYWSQLSEKEYAKEDNWFILSHLITDRQAPLYHYLVEHRDAFVKTSGKPK